MAEWENTQAIYGIDLGDFGEGHERIVIGQSGVTKIEPITKSGMYADIPYLRVWKGDVILSEWCQHNIIGVVFD